MTREEAKRFWLIRYENAKDFSDPHWGAQERREHREYVEALRMAIEALNPPIVQNMHKGKWIKKQVFNPELDKYVPLIECSVCGYEPYYGGSGSKYNYCPNCGTIMKGGAE